MGKSKLLINHKTTQNETFKIRNQKRCHKDVKQFY